MTSVVNTSKLMKNIKNRMNDIDDLTESDISVPSISELSSVFGGASNAGDVTPNINDIDTDDVFRVADLHFLKKNYHFRHLPDSYNKFVEEDIKNYLEYEDHTFTESITPTTQFRYRFKMDNIRIQGPMLDNGVEPLFPSMARYHNLTYSVKIFADITQFQDITDISSNDTKTNVVGTPVKDVLVAIIPLMVRSKWCSLTTNKGVDKTECDFDPGCYFIVKGSEKVVICQDRIVDNKPLIFNKKDTGLYVQVNSRSHKPNGLYQPLSIRFKKDAGMLVKVPTFNEVNAMILLKALGLETDESIIEYTTYDVTNTDMIELIHNSLDACKNDKGVKIVSQEEAQDFLTTKIKTGRKFDETNKDIKHAQKKQFVLSVLKNNFLPHVTGGMKKKAYYIGYMINKLLKAQLNKIQLDDRDSYVNKRIDMVGDLMFELYKQQHKKMLSECKRFFDSRNKDNEKPINIINSLKPNLIEQGITAALSTGHWLRRQGVAQILQRLSYLYTISLLRRIDAPGTDASTMKLTTPRHLHPSSVGFLCCVTGDTEILMGDKTTKQIKDLKDGDVITTVYKDSLMHTTSEIKNFFKKENQKVYEIVAKSGNKLKCTGDHPLLIKRTNSNEMVNAEDLRVGDNVFIFLNNDIISVPIELITECSSETVYDFTTVLDSHTLIANGFVTSNCVETPEHAKIGLTKHLAMISSISIMSREQYYLIQDYLMKNKLIMRIEDVTPDRMRDYNMYKVFFNGEWIGLTNKIMTLSDELDKMKLDGVFDPKNTSIVRDDDAAEIRVYCDSGRIYRPVLKVEDNIINLKKSHIAQISMNQNKSGNKISNWEDFLIKYPNVIEYIDMELQPYVMVAPRISSVEEMRRRMESSIDKIKEVKSQHVINRYDDMMYVKYNYCEIHPSLLMGEIMINTPFANRNAGPRNIFQYAQGRQAMCIYTTNYRKRLDISFILYKPQRSLVHTRGSVYTNIRYLPPGENCMVAIACYTG